MKLTDGSSVKANWLEAGGKGRLRFEIVDWDGDGIKDLLLATNMHHMIPDTIRGIPWSRPKPLRGATLLFLRKIVAGAADDSYGIEVAKLAGVPDTIITKAKTYLRELESGAAQPAAPAHTAQDDAQMTLGDAAGDVIAEQLRAIDLNTITPLEAMRLLFELQQKARG